MPKFNRDDEARINQVYLGANTAPFLQPIINEIKEKIGIKSFIYKCLELYLEKPEMFKEIEK